MANTKKINRVMKSKMKNEVLVIVRGGVVQNILTSNKMINVQVIDFDNMELSESLDAELNLKSKVKYLNPIKY